MILYFGLHFEVGRSLIVSSENKEERMLLFVVFRLSSTDILSGLFTEKKSLNLSVFSGMKLNFSSQLVVGRFWIVSSFFVPKKHLPNLGVYPLVKLNSGLQLIVGRSFVLSSSFVPKKCLPNRGVFNLVKFNSGLKLAFEDLGSCLLHHLSTVSKLFYILFFGQ